MSLGSNCGPTLEAMLVFGTGTRSVSQETRRPALRVSLVVLLHAWRRSVSNGTALPETQQSRSEGAGLAHRERCREQCRRFRPRRFPEELEPKLCLAKAVCEKRNRTIEYG